MLCLPNSLQHFATTGILAAAWPCGTIILISELFRSESISQVYGNLHQYFNDNPMVLSKLGMHMQHTLNKFVVFRDPTPLQIFILPMFQIIFIILNYLQNPH